MQAAELDRLLRAQQDPSSTLFHQWLTPEQFGERFGLGESDLKQITAWLRQSGFGDVEPARGRTFVAMSGTALHVRQAFGTSIRRYRVGEQLHYASSIDPVLPRALEGLVSGLTGLDDFHALPPGRRSGPRPMFTSQPDGSHFLAPGDLSVIYDLQRLYDQGIDGTGQTIAIVGASDIQVSNVEAFQSASGLPMKDPQIIQVGPDSGVNPNAQTEAYLDIEWAGAVAPGAAIVYVNSQSIDTSWTYAIDQNVGQVLSVSYGSCEPYAHVTADFLFQQANAQGMTIVASTGDNGSAECDGELGSSKATHGLTVLYPASSPNVTAVGGTSFNETGNTYWRPSNDGHGASALSYIPEVAYASGGGGASKVFAKPSWQVGAGVPDDGFRDLPDLALFAGGPELYLICSAGSCTNGFENALGQVHYTGGTSASAQVFAGLVALLNQKAQGSQGNINPALYALSSSVPTAFHDISTGSNIIPCSVGSSDCATGSMGYVAGPGYDQVTGLGSIDAYDLVTALSGIRQEAAVTLGVSGASFTPSQAGGSVGVTVAGPGSWFAWSGASWIMIDAPASGTGNGVVKFTVAPNSGAARTGTITVNGQSFTIQQEGAAPTGLSMAGSLAQIASAGGWDTSLTLVNLDGAANQARLSLTSDNGSPPWLPFTFPQRPAQGTVNGAAFNQTLAANAMFVFDTTGPANQAAVTGSAQLYANGHVGGFGIFEIQATGQQAIVPLEARNAASYILAFDNTNGLQTGLALANVSAAQASVKVVVRDDTGAVVPSKVTTIPLVGNGHASFMLNDTIQGFPELAGMRGTVEFDTPSGGQISVLGLRANGKAITTLPVLAQVGTNGGSLAHVATGGGWETIFTLVNVGLSATQITLSFYDEKTGAALPLALAFPQTNTTQTTASVNRTLAAGATLLVQTQGGSSTVACSAQLTTNGNVSGFAIFQIQASGQEAVVPLESRTSGTFVLAYDNMNGLATGLALANSSANSATVPVRVLDDTGATLTTGTVSLAANGHTSFMLADPTLGYSVTAGKRGTVQFLTPTGGHISALGIRAVNKVITTIPVLATATQSAAACSSYSYSATATIHHEYVAADASNYTVTLAGTWPMLATSGNGGEVTSINGYDICFADRNGRKLNWELESYDGVTGSSVAHVLVGQISSTADTQFVIYYGNSSVSTFQGNSVKAWDASIYPYVAIWHLGNGTSPNANDSSPNLNVLTNHGATATSGQIDGAAAFASAYMTANDSSSLDFSGPVSFSFWENPVKMGGPVLASRTACNRGNWQIYDSVGGGLYFNFWSGSTNVQASTRTMLSNGVWSHVVITYDGLYSRFYVNGQLTDLLSMLGTRNSNSNTVSVGTDSCGGYMQGSLDEVRVAAGAWPAGLIRTMYNNQSDPRTFVTISNGKPVAP